MGIFEKILGKGHLETESPEAQPSHQEKRAVHVVRSNGKIEKWDKALIFDNKVVLNTNERQPDGTVKNLTKEISRQEFDVVNFLGQLRDLEKQKAGGLDSETDMQRDKRVKELGELMRKMSEGKRGEVRDFLEEEALNRAEGQGISAKRIDELKEKLEIAQGEIKSKIKATEQKLEQVKVWIEQARKEGNLSRISGLELKSVEAYSDLNFLKSEKNKFSQVIQFLDALDAAEEGE